MTSKLTSWCEGAIEAGWLAAIVVTPLFFNIHSSRVFEPDKLTILRSIAIFMTVAWLIRFVDGRGWRTLGWLDWRGKDSIWRMPFVLPVALLVVVYLISSLFSVTRSVSWAGSYQRLQGTYTTLSYIVIFALMLATIRSREQVTRVVTTAIITSIPVALYAILQHFGLDPLPWGGDVRQRVAGHMGNSIFIAAFLIMVVPLTLARIIDAFTNILNDDELSAADVVRSSIYIFALAIQLIAIFWSRSRGPFLGLAVGIWAFVLILLVTLRNADAGDRRLTVADATRAISMGMVAVLAAFVLAATLVGSSTTPFVSFSFFVGVVGILIVAILVLAMARRGWRWLWASWILMAVTLALLLGLFNLSGGATQAYANTLVARDAIATFVAWRELPEVGRFGQLLESDSGTGRVRVLIWEGVVDLLTPHEPLELRAGRNDPFNVLRPIIGYGPESMYVAYNRFYQPELASIEARNASPDRSHNETFDALVITGVAGLIVWQFLYLSVFYYGFRWLGVVRSTRDRNVLIGLWIGGALTGALVITSLLGMPFLGVALPFGTIGGLVLYLIYFALFTRENKEASDVDPFGVDRLLLIALVVAVLAHYVEIHFGIAIAATRTYFFVYIAILFVVGFHLPRLQADALMDKQVARSRKRRRTRGAADESTGWVQPALSSALILALIVGVLGYNFTTFSLPRGETIEAIDDVPTTGEIFQQAFLTNANNGFAESPFIYMMVILTWSLGVLLVLSELAKQRRISLSAASSRLKPGRMRLAGLIFAAMLVASAAVRFLAPGAGGAGVNRLLASSLLWFWAALCLWASFRLFQEHGSARLTGGAVALVGLSFSIPVLAAGAAVYGLVLGLACAVVIFLLWDAAWKDLLMPAAVLAIVSLGAGLFYIYFHAYQLRATILPPAGVTETTPVLERRILEVDQTIGLLTGFYLFAFGILALTGLTLAQPKMARLRNWGTAVGLLAGLILIPAAFFVIGTTNLRIIQADIVYKRADPWDKEAGRTRNPELWDNAIAIYEHAIELAPVEDFYYLWLGRAYLERSSLTEDRDEQEILLSTAEDRLKEAQDINPLNTDHTANLARLNTRWAELNAGEERTERMQTAANYYDAAVSLSPNNALILNEYARLAFALQNDCEKSLGLYDRSLQVDPFYTSTLFDRAEIELACGRQQPEGQEQAYFEMAAASLTEGLERQPNDARRWMQLADIYIRLDDPERAIDAYQEASVRSGNNLPQWQLDLTMAQFFFEGEDLARAEEYGQRALTLAPENVADQVGQFLARVAEQGASAND